MAISPAPEVVVQTNLAPEDTQDLRISASAKLFEMYTNKVYSDKVLAVIREYCSNAWDAHREAGNGDVPFELQLPTHEDPTFRVRDFGISMTDEIIRDVFLEMFNSTKDRSNLVTGQMGIGSKAGFSIVDSMVLVRHLGGWSTSWVLARGTGGIPVMSLLGREETGEPDGFEVIIAVPEDLIDQFQGKAEKLSFGFMGNGAQSLPEPSYETVVSGEGWQIVRYSGFFHKVYVRQGCVLYPVPPEHFGDFRNPINGSFSDLSVIVELPLGSADPAPDRESLSFDPVTTRNVRNAIENAFEMIHYTVQTLLGSENNWLQKALLLRNFRWFHLAGDNRYGKVYLTGGSDWTIPEFVTTESWQYGGTNTKSRWSNHSNKEYSPSTPDIKFGTAPHPLAPKTVAPPRATLSFPVKSLGNLVFFVTRTGKGQRVVRTKERIFEWLGDHDRYTWEDAYILKDPSARQLERLVTLLGLRADQIVPVCTIEDPGAEEKEETYRPKVVPGVIDCRLYRPDIHSRRQRWRKLSELPEADYLWVECDPATIEQSVVLDGLGASPRRRRPSWGYDGGTYHHVRLDKVRETLKGLFLFWDLGPVPQFLGFSETAVKRFKPDPALELNTYLAAQVTKNAHRLGEYDTLRSQRITLDKLEGLTRDHNVIDRDTIARQIMGLSEIPTAPSEDNLVLHLQRIAAGSTARLDYEATNRAVRIARHFPFLFRPDRLSNSHIDGDHIALYIDLFHPNTAR